MWTIAEVRDLIDGVSQYGVGKWTEIKKLLFSSSAHRTPVDLKVGLPCLYLSLQKHLFIHYSDFSLC